MGRTTRSASGRWLGLALLAGAVGASAPAAVHAAQADELAARIWLDVGEDPVLRQGERVRLYYRTNYDAYVAVFHIDTNGTARMVFPRAPDENHYARGGRDYRLLFPRSTWWYVDEDPGVGYYFILASPEPFDFRDFRYSGYDGGWDLSFVGRTVYTDPYVAMDEYVARLIPDWEYVPYALDFLSYHVNDRYEYPRFLCYDCHGFQPYAVWNPYHYACTSFRVVVYSDPYYYPATRYRGDRVVYVRPPTPGLPRFEFKERGVGEPAAPLVRTRTATADRPGVAGDAVPRRSISGIGSGGREPTIIGAPSTRGGPEIIRGRPSTGTTGPGGSAPLGRPSDALPGRGGPVRVVPGTPRSGGDEGRPTIPTRGRPVLERRPPTGSGGTPTTRSGGGGPPVRVQPPRTGGGGSSAGPVTRRPTGGGGASTGPVTRRPTGGGSSGPVVRKPGGGGASSSSPARRSGGGSPPGRTRVRKPGGGGGGGIPAVRSRPAPSRSSAGGGPVVRRKPGGGGG